MAALALDAIEKLTGCATRYFLKRQQQGGQRRLHEAGEGMIAPPHDQNVVRHLHAALAQSAIEAEGIIIVPHHKGVRPAPPVEHVASHAIGIIGMPGLRNAE